MKCTRIIERMQKKFFLFIVLGWSLTYNSKFKVFISGSLYFFFKFFTDFRVGQWLKVVHEISKFFRFLFLSDYEKFRDLFHGKNIKKE